MLIARDDESQGRKAQQREDGGALAPVYLSQYLRGVGHHHTIGAMPLSKKEVDVACQLFGGDAWGRRHADLVEGDGWALARRVGGVSRHLVGRFGIDRRSGQPGELLLGDDAGDLPPASLRSGLDHGGDGAPDRLGGLKPGKELLYALLFEDEDVAALGVIIPGKRGACDERAAAKSHLIGGGPLEAQV